MAGQPPSGDAVREEKPRTGLGGQEASAVWPLRSYTHFAVGADGRAQELPGATPPIHAKHPQYLQEAQAPQGRGQDIALVSHGNHRHRSNQHEDVWREDRGWQRRGEWRSGQGTGEPSQAVSAADEHALNAAVLNRDVDRAGFAFSCDRGGNRGSECECPPRATRPDVADWGLDAGGLLDSDAHCKSQGSDAPRPSRGGTRGSLSGREGIWVAQVVEVKPEAQTLLYCGSPLQTAPETGTRLWVI